LAFAKSIEAKGVFKRFKRIHNRHGGPSQRVVREARDSESEFCEANFCDVSLIAELDNRSV
jgi:hypothetical protein